MSIVWRGFSANWRGIGEQSWTRVGAPVLVVNRGPSSMQLADQTLKVQRQLSQLQSTPIIGASSATLRSAIQIINFICVSIFCVLE